MSIKFCISYLIGIKPPYRNCCTYKKEMPFKSNPRRVKLHHPGLSSPLKFDSCTDAIEFLWNDVRNRSIKFDTVSSEFHKRFNRGKPLYGYRIEKDPNYNREVEYY